MQNPNSITPFLTLGFRPFFLFGSLHAGLIVGLWIPWYLGLLEVPSILPPITWHTHELLFGYVPAIAAGFLLTAMPNWTGRPPVRGNQLFLLVLFWLAGRLAITVSGPLPLFALSAISMAFPLALAFTVAREITQAKNERNYIVVAIISLLALSQLLFHVEFWRNGDVLFSARFALAIILMLIMIIGGRVIPNFTRNWLRMNQPDKEGTAPHPVTFNNFDKIAMVVAIVGLVLWTAMPALSDGFAKLAGAILIAVSITHFFRQSRWTPFRTISDPLMGVLHLAYSFIPLGFLFAGLSVLTDGTISEPLVIHTWTVGAVGLMTLAMITRVTRGHTGLPLVAPPSTVWLLAAIVVAALSRIAAALVPEQSTALLTLAAIAWVIGFFGYALLYGKALLTPRR